MPVGELLRRVSSREMQQWKLYFDDEPWGYDMENWRMALLAQVMASPHIKKGSRKPKLKDFLPQRKPRPTTDDEATTFGDPLD